MPLQPEFKLLDLAPEIVANVIQHIKQRKDLANIRLSCQTLNQHAVKELFSNVFVSIGEKDVRTWNEISQEDSIRRIPRHAIIHTQENVEELGWGEQRETTEDWEEFEEALKALSSFPNIESVEISFSPECVGPSEEDNWTEVAEDASQREEMLKMIFQAIADRARDPSNRTIRKLTILNLQNCPLPDFTTSDTFRDVMAHLDELHISIVQECNEHGPDHDYTREELRTFPAYFVSHWLAPVAANLKALSIYHLTDNWGPFPGFFDPSGVAFPILESLSLGYYTLAHDNDINWILAIPSLRKLVLHNCMIVSWICIEEENMPEWAVKTHDWTPITEGKDSYGEAFAYAGTWAQNLDRIAESLPQLVDFRFDFMKTYGDDEELVYGLLQRDNVGVSVYPQRYTSFDNGTLPSHWKEAEEDGRLSSFLEDEFPRDMQKEEFEGDQASLDRLMEVVRQRRQRGA